MRDAFFDGFEPGYYDSTLGAVISWVKWSGHQHTACHKYTQSSSSVDTTERYQGLIFDPALRSAPKLPCRVTSNERFKQFADEALLIGPNDQSWRYPLQVTIQHTQSAAFSSADF